MNKHISLYTLAACCLCLLFACKKRDGITTQPYDQYGGTASNKSLLKVNLAFAYTADPANLLIKINGNVVSNLVQQRTPFPGGGFNTRGSNFPIYLSIPQGNNTLSVIMPKVGTSVDSVVLFTGTVATPDTGRYTAHLSDTLVNATTNKTNLVLVNNIITRVDTGMCRFRFVNLIPNLTAVDLYLNNTLIKSNVAYKAVTDTFSLRTGVNAVNYAAFTTPTWTVRPAGAAPTTAAIATYASTNALQSTGVLTVYTMGYSGSTGARAPFVAFTLDKNEF